jgi:putative chitinase
MVNAEQLQRLHIGIEWVPALNDTFARFGIATPRQQAAFIGQCGHECGHFKTLEENLNYRAETLMKLWPRRFPTLEFAKQYEKNPRKIANSVYANRMGNREVCGIDCWLVLVNP